jgi:phosphoribosylamine--glycine ligase
MRILGIGHGNDLASMYLGLQRRGHAVRVHVADPQAQVVHAGLLAFTPDWQRELGWVREAGEDGLLLFESADMGPLQDALRAEGFRVIGGCALGDRLEADRALGQQVLRDAGLRTAATHAFDDWRTAADFVRARGGRWVLKFNGAGAERQRNLVGQMDDGSDVLAVLELAAARAPAGERPDFVLMAHVAGVEVGVGAFFDGHRFLHPAVIDFEHKHLFPGELGELTGEMGTVLSYRGSEALFDAVLAPLAPLLAEGGYVGYLNVNLIANADGLWPLEFTSRFGYPGYAICEALHAEPWEAIFARVLRGQGGRCATRSGWACGIVLTVPPFPWRHPDPQLARGLPVCLREGLADAQRERLQFAEVALEAGRLVTSGPCGYVGVATGTGAGIAAAQAQARRLAQAVVVPNLRWRHDIGDRLLHGELARLQALGWWSPAARPATGQRTPAVA